MNNVKRIVSQSPISAYFALAFAISWSIEGLLILSYNGFLSVPMWLHYLASFGPALAALAVRSMIGGRFTVSASGGARPITLPNRLFWLLFAVLSPILLLLISSIAGSFAGNKWPDFSSLGQAEYLGNIGAPLAFLLWMLTFGIGEEAGWRNFALPMLQKRFSFLASALIIGALWALWHIPAFFYKPQLMSLGPAGFFGFSLGVLCGSIFLAWLYNRSGGSLIVVAVWHAMFDLLTTSFATQGSIAAIESAIVMLCAISITLFELFGKQRRSRLQHQEPTLSSVHN